MIGTWKLGWGLGLASSPLIFWFSFVLLCASLVPNFSSYHLFTCSTLRILPVLSRDGGSKGFAHPQIDIEKVDKGKSLVVDNETGDLLL